jgi:hypothetical protein
MTLVIVQKTPQSISFSSDSRITFTPGVYYDSGIKIFPVPLKIYSPTDSQTQITKKLHEGILGMAVVGSTVSTYTIKDSICEILQHLQAVPGYTDLSLDNIASLVLKVFKKTTIDLCAAVHRDGQGLLIIGGWCPVDRRIKLFKFWSEVIGGTLCFKFEEILKADGVECFGSGKQEAIIAHQANFQLHPLVVIRDIIYGQAVPTVGGALQYGDFQGQDFEVAGIIDYEVDHKGHFAGYRETLRGIDVYKDDFERDAAGFHIEYTFMNPFQGEVDALVKKFLDEH